MHADGHLDVVVPGRLRRDLQAEPRVADAVVVADHALGLGAEDLGEVAGERHERAARLGRGHGEAAVGRRDEALGQEAVRRLDAVDAGQAQLLRQALLQRAEKARSIRPRASGEYDAMGSIPSGFRARPTSVG